jgi:hypothetical protein
LSDLPGRAVITVLLSIETGTAMGATCSSSQQVGTPDTHCHSQRLVSITPGMPRVPHAALQAVPPDCDAATAADAADVCCARRWASTTSCALIGCHHLLQRRW